MKTKIDYTTATASYTRKGSKWTHTLVDQDGNLIAVRNTANLTPYLWALIYSATRIEYRRDKPTSNPKGVQAVIAITEAKPVKSLVKAAKDAKSKSKVVYDTAKGALKTFRKSKSKVHSLPPGEEAKQMAAGQAASPMLQEKLAKAKAAVEVPAGHHVGKNGTVFKDTTPEQIEAARKALGIAPPIKVAKGKDATPLTQDRLRILARDLPEGSLNLFKHWIDVNGVMGGNSVETLDLFPAPGSTVKKDEGHLTDLKKRGLLSAFTEADGATWVELTPLGDQLQTYLATPQTPPPLVNPTLMEAVIKTGMTKVTQHRAVVTPAPKRVPAPKINRMLVRYEAVTFCMAKVKPAEFSKADYPPLMTEIETKYAPLYAKLKTPDKVRAYSTGIIDFCLAACRKNHLRSNA